MSNGKLCSFAGSMVHVGTPWRPGYYDIVAGWIPFPDTVAVAVENQGGTYIATLSATPQLPATTPPMMRVLVTLEYPSTAPAAKRQKLDFYTRIP